MKEYQDITQKNKQADKISVSDDWVSLLILTRRLLIKVSIELHCNHCGRAFVAELLP